MKKLTDHELNLNKENGQVTIEHKAENPEKSFSNQLVSALIKSDNTHSIDVITKGGLGMDPKSDEAYWKVMTPGSGSGTSIDININEEESIPMKDGTIETNTPLKITIAHELIHSKRADQGIMFRKDNNAEGKYRPESGKSKRPIRKEEIQARQKENKIRDEHGIDKRKVSLKENESYRIRLEKVEIEDEKEK